MIQNLKQPQLSAVKLREWQRYRGWTIKILAELEHSGGMTISQISNGVQHRRAVLRKYIPRMVKINLIEPVDRWGWRITTDGLLLLLLQTRNTNGTEQEHFGNTSGTQEKEEPAPSCFRAATCHIKRICRDKRFTPKTMTLCQNCVWDPPHRWIKPQVPVEKKGMGST